jgi:hypothetical protein
MMSGISFEQILAQHEKVPTLVVMGAGIDHNGLTEQSKVNARTAAGLLLADLAPIEPVLTVGKSPTKVAPVDNLGLTITEADEMSKIIEQLTFKQGLLPYVIAEDKSEDTIENLKNIAPYLEQFNIEEISIIASIGHGDRARQIARKIYGRRLGVLPIYSNLDVSKLAQARELYSRGLYGMLTAFSKPDTKRLEYGHRAYQGLMAGPKKIARKSTLSNSH